jgi:hypothetical protein
MGDVVNLNRFRKDKARKERAVEAERNRARFGRTKEEVRRQGAEAERRARELDAKRLDGPKPDPEEAG